MNRIFVDLDDQTAAALGEQTAGEALGRHGLAAFRSAEAVALADALTNPNQVLALGGGTPTAPGAAALLREHRAAGSIHIVYLAVDAATLRSRLAADPTLRPSLTGAGTVNEVESMLAERDPLYRQLADIIIDAGSGTASQIADRIRAAINPPAHPPA